MPTLDTLPAEKRAIIELLLRQGKSYEELADMLAMSESTVREHARDALRSLAPRTADRVDAEWAGQVADYVLLQQSGPQATATRSHLKRSEPARAWALSALDSLGDLYGDDSGPEIPEAGAEPERESRSRRGRGRRHREGGGRQAGAGAPGAGAAASTTAADAASERPESGQRPRSGPGDARRGRSATDPDAPATGVAGETGSAQATATRPERDRLSPEAQKVVRRRRVLGALAAAAVIVVGLVILLTSVLGNDDPAPPPGSPAEEAAQAQPEILAQAELTPQGNVDAAGGALVLDQAGQRSLFVQARLPEIGRDEAYEVWLYNDRGDAASLGAQVVDQQGNFQGIAPLPEDYEQYRFVDISREPTDGGQEHSGDSVLRGRIEEVPAGAVPGGAAPGGAAPGAEVPGGTAPGGTAPGGAAPGGAAPEGE